MIALARCRTCGTAVTLDPPPAEAWEELNDGGAFRAGRPRGAGIAAPLLARFDHQRLALHRRGTPPPARLLDAGAGRGRFVASARAAGYAAEGLEPAARGTAAEGYGVALTRASIEAFTPPEPVEAISLWHVLEHVEDPAGTLTRLHGWLAPGGTIVVGVPNLASLQARVGGDRWYHLDLPRHRTHFTARGLRTLLERTGFEVVHEQHVLAEHNPFGLWVSAVSRLTARPSYLYHLLKRNAPVSWDLAVTLLALPLVPVAVGVELMAGLGRRGGTVAVLARKRN